jgi:hypothetical protein
MDVWHVPLDATVHDNDHDPVVTREAVFAPPPTGRLCLIRFDVPRAQGDFRYGLKPPLSPGECDPAQWAVKALKRGAVLDQSHFVVRLSAIHLLVEGPRAPAAESGNACREPWSRPRDQTAGRSRLAGPPTAVILAHRAPEIWTGGQAFVIRPSASTCGVPGGRIAQLVEQLTLNQRVLGSSPSAPTNKISDLRWFLDGGTALKKVINQYKLLGP